MISKKSLFIVLLSVCSMGLIEAKGAKSEKAKCLSKQTECACTCSCGERSPQSTDKPAWSEEGIDGYHCFCGAEHRDNFKDDCVKKKNNS